MVLLFSNQLFVFAHEKMLNVEYDDCSVPRDHLGSIKQEDGEDETWYWLIWNNSEYHISHEVDTITYYFADSSRNLFDTYTWTTDITEGKIDIKDSLR